MDGWIDSYIYIYMCVCVCARVCEFAGGYQIPRGWLQLAGHGPQAALCPEGSQKLGMCSQPVRKWAITQGPG